MNKKKKIVLSKNSGFPISNFVLEQSHKMRCKPIYFKEENYWLLPINKNQKIEFYPSSKDSIIISEYYGVDAKYILNRYRNLPEKLPFFIAQKGLLEDNQGKNIIQKEGLVIVSEWSWGVVFAALGKNCCSVLNFADFNLLAYYLEQLELKNASIHGFYLTLFDLSLGDWIYYRYFKKLFNLGWRFPIYIQTSSEFTINSEITLKQFKMCFKKIDIEDLINLSIEEINLNVYDVSLEENINWVYDEIRHISYFNIEQNCFLFYNENSGCWETKSQTEVAYLLTKSIWNAYNSPKIRFEKLLSALKTVSARVSLTEEEFLQKFTTKDRIGFTNGCYFLKDQKLQPHQKDNYLLFSLPYHFQPVSGSIQRICPTICHWLADRVNHEEIYLNILLACMYCVVLEIHNPERFLLLSGTSATGKTTFINLLTSLISPHRFYAAGPEDLLRNFGLQDFRGLGKYLLVTPDLGIKGSISESFVSLIRSFVSVGETRWVDKKYDDRQKICFNGLYVTSSNGNPFAYSQREGLINRRLLFVPFEKTVSPEQTLSFDQLFPEQERERFVSFAVQQNADLIRRFLQVSSQHPLVRQNILDSYELDQHSAFLQYIIETYLVPDTEGEMVFGSSKDAPRQSCFAIYKSEAEKFQIPSNELFALPKFRKTLTALIHSLYPEWKVRKMRKSIYKYKREIKIWVLKNVRFQNTPREEATPMDNPSSYGLFDNFREMPFWCDPQNIYQSQEVQVDEVLETQANVDPQQVQTEENTQKIPRNIKLFMKNSGFAIDIYASLEENWDRLLAQYPYEWPYVMPRAFRDLYNQAFESLNQQIFEKD